MTDDARDSSLLVIGGGIAGASVAYFAARAGWSVTVIDAGVARASDVPGALLNPVRGQSGRVDPRATEGLRLSWALIGSLIAQGHPVPYEQGGVLRAIADEGVRDRFEHHLPGDLPHRWLGPEEAPAGLAPGWPHLLRVEEGGWVSGPALVSALLAASGAEVVRERVTAWDDRSVRLENGGGRSADAVVWCGGSVGATWGGGRGMSTESRTHRGGSVLLLAGEPFPLPVSAGVYLSPTVFQDGSRGGLLGATFEAPSARCNAAGPPLKSLHWLLSRAAALSVDFSPTVTGLWSGSRLSGEQTGRQPGGWWALSGLGSKGFLLGPLLARELVAGLTPGVRSVVQSSPGE